MMGTSPQPDLLVVGYIRKTHGVRGDVIIRLTTNRSERADVGEALVIGDETRKIISSRPHQGDYLVHFEGIDGRDEADALRGEELLAEPIDDPDELWVHELIGCEVVDSGGLSRGAVIEVVANPASDLLSLDTGALVPLRFLTSHEAGVITVDVPDGLFELYDESGDE